MLKRDPEISEQVCRQKAMRFGASILIALTCVFLLSLVSCTKSTNDDENNSFTDPSCVEYTSFADEIVCSDVYMPVCGCDGQTYKNACEAMYYNGLINYTAGACQVDDSCRADVASGSKRNFTYAPVCGCDGETYSNSDDAESNGVYAVAEGLCNTIFLDVCKDQTLEIGVVEKAGKIYHWEGDIKHLSCIDCPTVTISGVSDMELILFESDFESTSINKIYPYSISRPDSCF